ncbi:MULTISPECIES: transcriptional regulator VisR [Alphaproteobacteria]|uniref:Helix-turn-helix transcriptional regulator n=2 Tax=Alphaproteobacteria TaxID=28211 RepID=A0A512HDD2_9HYPH|nr:MULTISPECIES: helix-turn-helix transcriptional regulator [Alphaproteobacteria]GEO83458.1 helix-turn-helix transcriptional regulator [Ciceribacter naphthalenivorans]GLR24392.1 helix-turn-helix transcriptional regulator [Ciceribacter naphthalenivorans]GLT07248.1 helix-turn-helix transcriptional regulator [Sphingomonas psychrolutea]
MAYPEGPFETVREDLKASISRQVTSRSDIFPKLVSLQRALHARGVAVLRVSGAGMAAKRRLVAEYESWPAAHGMGCDPFIATYGEILLNHIEASILPILWSAEESGAFAEASDFVPFVVQLEQRGLAYSGIAFPVRLGAFGNGYVMFPTTGAVDLPGELILDVHGRCYKVMTEILTLEERRVLPSETLSEREIACLQLAGDGRISEEIAEHLKLSVHTVNAYLGSATIKLDSVNRIQAIAKAIRLGYIT